jgi:hypothetical protein
MIKLNLNRPDGPTGIGSRIASIYDHLAGGDDDHLRNDRSLQLIQFFVITVSACATGAVNAFAHRGRLGWVGASLLAVAITCFVEKFYFTLRHGLARVYRSRKQRFLAKFFYHALKLTMILNAAILCAWVVDMPLPEFLAIWYRYSIVLHFVIALLGVAAVRDHDASAENRIREMQAEAAEHDLITIRRAAATNHLFLFYAAKFRGWLDGVGLAIQLIRDNRNKPEFSARYIPEMNDGPPRLCLPGEAEDSSSKNKVTDILGKRQRR